VASSGRILIIGGGFAGSTLAVSLRKKLPESWEIVLFSRENHFVFTPLLAEVVGAAIDPLHVVWPVREMVQGVACRTSAVESLDLERKEVVVTGPSGEPLRERWDHLVIACGQAADLSIVPGMEQHAWPLKTLGDALALRNHVIQQLELAEAEPDPERRARLLSFAVVGGGFTGVEVAGSIMDLLIKACRFYQRFGPRDLKVTIVDGGPRILGPLPEDLSEHARKDLEERGVDVLSGQSVKEVTADGIALGDGNAVSAGSVISAVGTNVQPLLAGTSLPMERRRLVVSGEMRVEGHDDIWALGDCAAVPNAFDQSVSPTLGQFAVRQARQLATNLEAVIAGRAPGAFHYHTKGMFAAVGHSRAVGNPFGRHVTGFSAYVMWRAIYWSKMPTLTRRVQIGLDWLFDVIFKPSIVEISTLRTGSSVENAGDAPGGERRS
jgi:NADH dehydrogenase